VHRHDFAVYRRAHDLTLDLIGRRAQALFELAHFGGRLLELIGRLLLILVAGLRDAGLELADALACERELAAVLAHARDVVRRVALQLEQARTIDEAVAHQLVIDRELFGRKPGRSLGCADLRLQRVGLRV
jgi:hypothetical protein